MEFYINNPNNFPSGLHKLNSFSEIFQETKKHFNDIDPTKVTYYYIKAGKIVVIDTEESFKEYQQSYKNVIIKVYFVENNKYKYKFEKGEFPFELNKHNSGSKSSQEKFDDKLEDLQKKVESILTHSQDEFKKAFNKMIGEINKITNNNPKLKNYFETKLYETCQYNNICDFDINIIKNENESHTKQGPEQKTCQFCSKRFFEKGYMCALSSSKYILCDKCNDKLSMLYPHNFVEIE